MTRRTLATLSAALLLGTAALTGGCIAPADGEGQDLDEAELTGEASDALETSCDLLSGYTEGSPPLFPDTHDPVVGFKYIGGLYSNEFGTYQKYRIQFCHLSNTYTEVYYFYVSGPLAWEWLDYPEYEPL